MRGKETMGRSLTHDEAKAVYDRIGSLLDAEFFMERRVYDELINHSRFEEARAVFEFGPGTGRLAEILLRDYLPPEATYLGVDVSPRMVRLARERLRKWEGRAEVRRTEGSVALGVPDGRFDRFVSCYVLELLAPNDLDALLSEARRILVAGGFLCIASMTSGTGPGSRLVADLWSRLHAVNPKFVGGCRPIELARLLDSDAWRIVHRAVVCQPGIRSEVVVAAPRPTALRASLGAAC